MQIHIAASNMEWSLHKHTHGPYKYIYIYSASGFAKLRAGSICMQHSSPPKSFKVRLRSPCFTKVGCLVDSPASSLEFFRTID